MANDYHSLPWPQLRIRVDLQGDLILSVHAENRQVPVPVGVEDCNPIVVLLIREDLRGIGPVNHVLVGDDLSRGNEESAAFSNPSAGDVVRHDVNNAGQGTLGNLFNRCTPAWCGRDQSQRDGQRCSHDVSGYSYSQRSVDGPAPCCRFSGRTARHPDQPNEEVPRTGRRAITRVFAL